MACDICCDAGGWVATADVVTFVLKLVSSMKSQEWGQNMSPCVQPFAVLQAPRVAKLWELQEAVSELEQMAALSEHLEVSSLLLLYSGVSLVSHCENHELTTVLYQAHLLTQKQ
eukprot:CAMPEP_0169178048 /NCGR_PEP_ID=MMETSP1015-20121227/66856_1 /TAXON_ID=342587 /ORGANISM="Karlodinium micrum, Strain CCMP2283" /LENGTH=113 /DNA_ID=CAMNT_0009252917 /DNA_START=67 /DNA_END=408 /DNA_ORIENTATION=-